MLPPEPLPPSWWTLSIDWGDASPEARQAVRLFGDRYAGEVPSWMCDRRAHDPADVPRPLRWEPSSESYRTIRRTWGPAFR